MMMINMDGVKMLKLKALELYRMYNKKAQDLLEEEEEEEITKEEEEGVEEIIKM